VNTIKYFEQVAGRLGGFDKAADRVRLFLAPGMGHCRGGEGPNVFDAVGALEQWVEHGTAPAQLLATHSTNGKVDRSRPLCPHPQVAAYKGTGSIDDAANFVCR
jgi:feruloyl esterase